MYTAGAAIKRWIKLPILFIIAAFVVEAGGVPLKRGGSCWRNTGCAYPIQSSLPNYTRRWKPDLP